MNLSSLPTLEAKGVVIRAENEDEELVVRFSGNADTRVKDEIHHYLVATHEVATSHQLTKVVIDLRDLEFMNSACFKAFVTWLATVRNLDKSQQYNIHFLSNDKIHWQRRSLRALSYFAASLVRIHSSRDIARISE